MRFTKLILMAGLAIAGIGGVASADPYYYDTSNTYDPAAAEPAPGTYENGYVWVGGSYQWIDGANVWVQGHWQLATPPMHYETYAAPVYVPPVVVRPRYWFHRDHDRDFDHDRDDRRGWRAPVRVYGGGGYERGGHWDGGGRTARSYRHGSRR